MLNLYHIFSIVDLFIAAPIPRHFIIETSDTKLRHYDDLDLKENVDKGMVNKCHSLYCICSKASEKILTLLGESFEGISHVQAIAA